MLSISLLGGLGAVDPLISAKADRPVNYLDPSLLLSPVPAPGECTADGSMIWVSATATDPGYWSRLRAGQQCTTVGSYVPQSGASPQGGIGPAVCYARGTNTVVDCPPVDPNAPPNIPRPIVPGEPQKMIQVGPFTIPYEARQFTIHWSAQLPADWQIFINQEIAHDCQNCVFSSMVNSSDFPDLKNFLGPGMPALFNQDFLIGAKYRISGGMFSKDPTLVADKDLSDYNPIVLTQHPDTGEDYGIYMAIGLSNPALPYDEITNPHIMNLLWRKVERSWYAAIWNFIKKIVAKIVQIAGELICTYVCTPDAVNSAMKAALASKNPYAVAGAAIGSAIAIGNCSCPLPSLNQPTAPTNYTAHVVVGFAVLLGLGAILYQQAK